MRIKANDENEARKILMQSGIQFFRIQAGYIAKSAAHEDCRGVDCKIEIEDSPSLLKRYSNGMLDLVCWKFDDDEIEGQIRRIFVRAKVCWDCARQIDMWYGDDVSVNSSLNDEYCQLCGKFECGIPF